MGEMDPRTKNNVSGHRGDHKYLEEALLSRSDVKYSDLALILGNDISNITKHLKKSVIETNK